jgi:hypothetical protein
MKNQDDLLSRKAWKERGRSVPRDAKPARIERWSYPGSGSGERHLFTFDQTKAIRKKHEPQILSDVIGCLFTLNRRAKRCRDQAQSYYRWAMHGFAGKRREEKEECYDLKDQALAHLLAEGKLRETDENNRIPDGNIAQVVTDGRFSFHRPVPGLPPGAALTSLDIVEAKPKDFREPRIVDAIATVRAYLEGKPILTIYRWPERTKPKKIGPEGTSQDYDEECARVDEEDWDEDF